MMRNKPVVIYPPTVDWDHMHQRPQQLLKAVSRQGCISVFCNTNSSGRQIVIEQLADTLYLANTMDFAGVVNRFRQQYKGHPIVVYYSYPDHVHLAHSVNADLVIFDSLDEPVNEFAHWIHNYEASVKRANIVIASAESLRDRAREYRDDVVLVPNGCEYDHFTKAQQQIGESPFKTNKTIVGFVGAVASWLDWPLIERIVRDNPQLEFVFIGELWGGVSELHASNVSYLGHIDYADLPRYMSHFDVCWIPFQINEMTKGVNPIKMWEYLATGKPVLSTPLPEGSWSVMYKFETAEEFEQTMDYLMRGNGQEIHGQGAYVAEKFGSWDERAQRIMEVLK